MIISYTRINIDGIYCIKSWHEDEDMILYTIMNCHESECHIGQIVFYRDFKHLLKLQRVKGLILLYHCLDYIKLVLLPLLLSNQNTFNGYVTCILQAIVEVCNLKVRLKKYVCKVNACSAHLLNRV